MKTRILSIMLAVMLVAGLLPVSAFAVSAADTPTFTLQPIGGNVLEGNTLTVDWETSFTPTKLVMRKYVEHPVDGLILMDKKVLDTAATTCELSAFKSGYYILLAYYNDTEYVASEKIVITEKSAGTDVLFTADSAKEAGGTVTVDIEVMAEASEMLMEAYFNNEVTYQWYRNGLMIRGATGEAITLPQEGVGDTYCVMVTYGDYISVSEPIVITGSAYVYVGGVAMWNGDWLDEAGVVSTTPLTDNYAHLEDGVLTLHNYDYEGEGYYNEATNEQAIVYSTVSLEIRLEGNNTFYYDGESFVSGVVGQYAIIIGGDGTLHSTTVGDSVYTYDGEICVEGGTLDFTTGCRGLNSASDNVYVSGGTITINSTDDSIYAYYDITVTAGDIALTSNTDDGIFSDFGTVTVEGGNIAIDACDDGICGYDDDLDEDIVITGGTIDVTAGYCGLHADYSDLVITGGDITLNAEVYGIICYVDLMIDGGNLTIQATATDGCAVYCSGTIAIAEGMKVQAADEPDGTLGAYVAEDIDSYNLIVIEDASVLLGDVNGDGKVNVADSVLLFAAVSGRRTLTETQQAAADMSGDGKINIADSMKLFKQISGR